MNICEPLPSCLHHDYHPRHWWQLLADDEWHYQRPVEWRRYPSGTVVIYE